MVHEGTRHAHAAALPLGERGEALALAAAAAEALEQRGCALAVGGREQRLAHEDRARGSAEHDMRRSSSVEFVGPAALRGTDALTQLAQVDVTEPTAEHGHGSRVGVLDRSSERRHAGLPSAVGNEHDPVLAGLHAQVDGAEHEPPHVGVGMGAALRRRRELDHRPATIISGERCGVHPAPGCAGARCDRFHEIHPPAASSARRTMTHARWRLYSVDRPARAPG